MGLESNCLLGTRNGNETNDTFSTDGGCEMIDSG